MFMAVSNHIFLGHAGFMQSITANLCLDERPVYLVCFKAHFDFKSVYLPANDTRAGIGIMES